MKKMRNSRCKSIVLLFVINLAFFFPTEASFPEVVDFSKFRFQDSYYELPGSQWEWKLGETAYKMGLTAFNDAPEMGVFFNFIKERCKIHSVVETGTYRCASALFFSKNFNEVHTIDVNEGHYLSAREIFANSNVHCYLGSSEKVMPHILPSLQGKRTLFYLDAHWHNHWPLLEELHEISKTHRDNCIIVIDDFKVPGRPDIAYDGYNGLECSHEYVAEGLNQVFSEYTYYYLVPRNLLSRAKFVAIPKAWAAALN